MNFKGRTEWEFYFSAGGCHFFSLFSANGWAWANYCWSKNWAFWIGAAILFSWEVGRGVVEKTLGNWRSEFYFLFFEISWTSVTFSIRKVQCCVKVCDAGQMESTEVVSFMQDGTELSASHLVWLPLTALAHYFNMMCSPGSGALWKVTITSHQLFPWVELTGHFSA